VTPPASSPSPIAAAAALPNLFLVGAAKAATTSLALGLSAHQDIFLSPIKEPNFFAFDIAVDRFRHDYRQDVSFDEAAYFAREQLSPRHIAFVRRPENYLRLFEPGARRRYRLDASVSYAHSACAAREIARANPAARVIMILRHPVARAWSHHLADVNAGYARLDEFIGRLRHESRLPERHWGRESLLLDLGLYAAQIRRFQQQFPPSQLIFIRFEDFLGQPSQVIGEVLRRLELDPSGLPKGAAPSAKHNPSQMRRLPWLQSALKPVWRPLRRWKQDRGWHGRWLRRWLWRAALPQISVGDSRLALEHFAHDIVETQRLTGLDLSAWLNLLA
jgi:hypothetical protein